MTSLPSRLTLALAVVLLPVVGLAQEAILGGSVTDSTGGVLPGAVITAVHDATGNTFQAVADERGAYRLPVRIGAFTVTAELQGFGTDTRKVQVLVGQAASINFQLSLSSVQETVTVTSEAPLIEVSQSKLGGNIDPRQMQELPVNGRNWMDLATLAPGARTNESSDTGPVAGTSRRDFQINIDGQQVTSNLVPTTSQPRVSRDAIAEFQFVASRFDATQGRSTGVQVNAVTKSGTNTLSGSMSGYFRHDAFNAKDFIQDEVLPVLEPAAERDRRWSAHQEPAALLRQLRVPARAAYRCVQHAVPVVQLRPVGHAPLRPGGHPARLPDLAEHPVDDALQPVPR